MKLEYETTPASGNTLHLTYDGAANAVLTLTTPTDALGRNVVLSVDLNTANARAVASVLEGIATVAEAAAAGRL